MGEHQILMETLRNIQEQLRELKADRETEIIPKVLSIKQVEFHYDLKSSTQAKYRSKKRASPMPFSKNGGIIKYDRDTLENWLLNRS